MNCECHGEAMYWNGDSRYRAGGFWRCAVRKRAQLRASHQRYRDARLEAMRDRYDADPVFRIEKQLHDQSRKRGETLKRKREAISG